MEQTPPAPEPDDKDWTWVLSRPCPECGFDAATIAREDIAGIVVDAVARWQQVLVRDDVAARPAPAVWSPLEYGCHTRDVFGVFAERVSLMQRTDNPTFPNWDQDETAREAAYWSQDPTQVSRGLTDTGGAAAAAFAGVAADEWTRPGTRSNGSEFTIESLGRYFVHDVVHHLHDVAG